MKNQPDPIARRIASGLGRLALALRAGTWKRAADEGITPTQGEALVRLADTPHGMRLSDLAQQLGVSAPTASDVVSTLAAKALVAKHTGIDKRSVTLKLTNEGKRLASRVANWTDFMVDATETLDDHERDDVLAGLIKIIRALQENGDISPQRMCVTCEHFRPNAHNDAASPHHCAFIDTAFGASSLRLNCADHNLADNDLREKNWNLYVSC